MVEIDNELYDYPVTINTDEIYKALALDLKSKLNVEQDVEVKAWLNMVHEAVYNHIYKVAGKDMKDRIIMQNSQSLTKPLKRALLAQLQYSLEANGDFGTADGSSVNADGQLIIVNNKILKEKIVAPKVITILEAARPNLLLGGDKDV